MFEYTAYYNRYRSARGQLTGLPDWAKLLVFLAAVPGILLALLSLLALGVSILALLLLTVPVYRLLKAATGASGGRAVHRDEPAVGQATAAEPVPPRRHIDVTIVE